MTLFNDHEDLSARVRQEIAEIEYATLATVSNSGEPWNNPVYTAFDGGYNFYWGSPEEATHSQNIESNGKVAMVIYDSRCEPGTGKGVYIKARAHRVTDEGEQKRAYGLLIKRRGADAGSYWRYQDFLAHHAVHIYKAEPVEISTHGGELVNGIYLDRRRPVQL
jgi:uncharacterized protein YhbP (UPF0306 family)